MRAGVVVKLPPGLAPVILARSSTEHAASLAFVDAREVRAIVVPEVVRLLGEAAGARVGVAVVEGRVHAAFDFRGDPSALAGAALLVAAEPRGEAFVVLGLEVVEAGSFAGAPTGDAVVVDGARVPVASVADALRGIDAAAWAAHGAVGIARVRDVALGSRP